MSKMLSLYCLVLAAGATKADIFDIKIPDTETGIALKRAIKEELQVTFPAHTLKLWGVSVPVDDEFEIKLEDLKLDDNQQFSPVKKLSSIFSDIQEEHLHVVVQLPASIHQKRPLPEPADNYLDRLKRSKIVTTAPSKMAQASKYVEIQEDPFERIFDDRPKPDADIPPIPLLYNGFGHFLDVMDGRDDVPGLADINAQRLHKAVDDLASMMIGYFKDENDRRDAALPCLDRIFSARTGVIIPSLRAAAIGSVRSDGHNIAAHGAGAMVVEFKNWITGINAIPQIEIVGYVSRLNTTTMGLSDSHRDLHSRWRVPCVGLTIVGCDITFYAIIAIDYRFRLVSLTPTLSCLPSASDGRDRTSLYSAFTAASVLQAHILQDIENRPNDSSLTPIPALARHFPAVFQLRKYPSSDNSYLNFEIRAFFPDRQPYRLLYVAETGVDKQLILIKFARQYSIDLHEFCAQFGHAPRILAFERLPGGWYAVAMEFVESGLPITHPDLPLDHRDRWTKELQNLISSFHARGLVHGDLRDANIICKGDSVMLIDFDWGGKDGQVFYPTAYLNQELLDGRASDDLRITQEDDRRVLRKTLAKLGADMHIQK